MRQTTRRIALFFCFTLSLAVLPHIVEAQTFTVLHTFTGNADGSEPGGAGVTIDRAGNLYGATDVGANDGCYSEGCGVVYKLTHTASGWTFNTVFMFNGTDGSTPDAPLTFGPDGALYGTTYTGGDNNVGVVYRLQPPPTVCKTSLCFWTQTVLHSFTGSTDGAQPAFGALTFDAAGDIYGTTTVGGDHSNSGNVWELSRNNGQWVFNVLYLFTRQMDGGTPWSGVILDPVGNLYGTNLYGGEFGNGIVYQLSPSGNGWALTSLHDFMPASDGDQSFGNLLFHPSGNLLATDRYGGPGSAGLVFELSPHSNAWAFSVLHSFDFSGFNGPQAPLVRDASGNLYGTSVQGGQYEKGFVFELMRSGGGYTYSVLHDFSGGDDGANPYSQIVLDANSNLYGAAEFGGMTGGNCHSYGCGVVWEITP